MDNTSFDIMSKEEIKKLPEKELLEALKYYKDELEDMKERIKSKSISSLQLSEFQNSDKKYIEDRIKVIEEQIDARKLK